LPVDETADEQTGLFLIEAELAAAVKEMEDHVGGILVEKGLDELYLTVADDEGYHFVGIEDDLDAVFGFGAVEHLITFQQKAVEMPVLSGGETMLEQVVKVRGDAVDVEEFPPGDLFGEDESFLEISVKGVDDLAIIFHREDGFRDEAAFGKVIDNKCLLDGAAEQGVRGDDLAEGLGKGVIFCRFELEIFDGDGTHVPLIEEDIGEGMGVDLHEQAGLE
jgi:hypothetical protein